MKSNKIVATTKRNFFKVLIFLLVFGGISFNLLGQKYARNQFTVYSYVVNIDENVKSQLSRFESSIKYKPTDKQNKTEAMLIHGLYNLTTQILSDSLSIFFLPTNSLGTKVKYSDYGYADITIQKAIRLADTKYFLKILAYVENDLYDDKNNKLPEGSFKPKIRLSIDIYNKYGYIPLQTSNSIITVKQPFKLSVNFLAGMNFVDESVTKQPNSETLADLFTKAILEAYSEIKYKSK